MRVLAMVAVVGLVIVVCVCVCVCARARDMIEVDAQGDLPVGIGWDQGQEGPPIEPLDPTQ
jgi:hypothetical protein